MKRTDKRPTPGQTCRRILTARPMKRCKREATAVLVDRQGTEHWTCEVCARAMIGGGE